ncbi:peptidase inhibitor family I36 protein [Streptomyces sp. NPDC005648]|uniref:peptidase inhibitor family I36 protein n=1 Tax=Streptomyces sp. NPDC005648 TaxID=3157044 RepID=UPI0033B2B71E
MLLTRRITARIGMAGAAAALALGGLATQASASSAVIDGSNGFASPSSCNTGSVYYFCLYYSPDHTGGTKAYTATAVSTISGDFTGTSHPVRNDAASAANGSGCHVGIWVSPGYTGNSNWMNNGNRGGNLTSANSSGSVPQLRNNEASIAVDDSTNCPGVGIG